MAETTIFIEIPGTAEMHAKLAAKPAILHRGLARALRLSGEAVLGRAIQNVSGVVLHVQTGTLRRRLMRTPVDEATLSLEVGSPTLYAPIHEYGMTVNVPAHQRRLLPRTASGVRLSKKPRAIRLTTVVRAHTATYPPRPFLRPAVFASIPDIKKVFIQELGKAVEEAQ